MTEFEPRIHLEGLSETDSAATWAARAAVMLQRGIWSQATAADIAGGTPDRIYQAQVAALVSIALSLTEKSGTNVTYAVDDDTDPEL